MLCWSADTCTAIKYLVYGHCIHGFQVHIMGGLDHKMDIRMECSGRLNLYCMGLYEAT